MWGAGVGEQPQSVFNLLPKKCLKPTWTCFCVPSRNECSEFVLLQTFLAAANCWKLSVSVCMSLSKRIYSWLSIQLIVRQCWNLFKILNKQWMKSLLVQPLFSSRVKVFRCFLPQAQKSPYHLNYRPPDGASQAKPSYLLTAWLQPASHAHTYTQNINLNSEMNDYWQLMILYY